MTHTHTHTQPFYCRPTNSVEALKAKMGCEECDYSTPDECVYLCVSVYVCPFAYHKPHTTSALSHQIYENLTGHFDHGCGGPDGSGPGCIVDNRPITDEYQ